MVVCFSWSRLPSTTVFFFFLLGLLLYLLTVILYISQSGSGAARRGVGGCTQLAAPSGVPLYLCVRDACDIAVEEILKRSMRTAGVESPSVRFHHFFFLFFLCPEDYNKAPF